MCEAYYGKLQPYCGHEKSESDYIDTDAFVLKFRSRDLIKNLQNLNNFFHSSNSNKDHEIFCKKKQKSGLYVQKRNA